METLIDWSLVQSVVLSLALGGLIGLERQSHHEPEESLESIGVRTFALASLLGTLSPLSHQVTSSGGVPPYVEALPYVTGVGYLALIISFLYFEYSAREKKPGITTQVSALIVYVIGALVPSQPVFAAVVAVLVASILSIKNWTHRLVQNLTDREVLGTMKFLLISVVLLPLLPSKPIDPWGVYNLQELWFLVVLVSGISFAGYFAMRFMGRDHGLAVTGALGGLASSTAVTLAMSQRAGRAADDRAVNVAAAFGILVASGIMTVRVLFIVAAVAPKIVAPLALPVLAMAIPGVGVAGYFWTQMGADRTMPAEPEGPESSETVGESTDADDLEIENPFELTPALKFGLLFVVIIGGVHFARRGFGDYGTYIAAFVSGLANMDAISLEMGRMLEAGDIGTTVAVRGVVIAIIANSFSKAVLSATIGSKKLGIYVTAGLIPMAVVGLGMVTLV